MSSISPLRAPDALQSWHGILLLPQKGILKFHTTNFFNNSRHSKKFRRGNGIVSTFGLENGGQMADYIAEC